MEENEEGAMSFWNHMEELLTRLRIILVAIFLSGSVIGFWPSDLNAFLNPLNFLSTYNPMVSTVLKRIQADQLPQGVRLIAGTFVDTVEIYLVVSVLIGLIVSAPIVAYEIYKFVNPALLPKERRFMGRFVFGFISLFAAGALFAYKVIVPITFLVLGWFIVKSGAEALVSIKEFVYIVVILVGGVGLFFTFPLFVLLLVQAGVLSAATLSSKKKLIYAGLLIAAIILTPDPTPFTTIALFIPFMVLFETTLWLAKRLESQAEAP